MSSKTGIVKKKHRIFLSVRENEKTGALENADKLLDLMNDGWVISIATPAFRTGSVHYILENFSAEYLGQAPINGVPEQVQAQMREQVLKSMPPSPPPNA